jgi:N-acetylglucosaminyldiphosphoundecaprenol N-acetyl-beta-D-mannosaminyltransferase
MKPLSAEECLSLEKGVLVTLNLQHLYEAFRSEDLRRVLATRDNVYFCVDGRGARLLLQRAFGVAFPLVPGNMLLAERLSCARGQRVLVVGSSENVIAGIRELFPSVCIAADHSVFRVRSSGDATAIAESIVARHDASFDLVAVALGVPKQEILGLALARLLPKSSVWCIGGSFEIISGRYPRAPLWAQRLGLEGFWRLALQPTRERFMRLFESYASFAGLYFTPGKIRRLFHVDK